MNRMKHLFCVLLLAALGSFSFKANAYTERNMLQKAADETTLKNVLVMKQAWVPYPAYTDRAAWDSLMGPNKQRLIEAGEKLLDYKWQLLRHYERKYGKEHVDGCEQQQISCAHPPEVQRHKPISTVLSHSGSLSSSHRKCNG